ncbi:acetyltransferase [Paenibacillus sp. LHD-117]|uniref:acetyltransferase n=1 Tax=Paenibacillus sp. LHD-117 TaxID=3071412 RepID=UPI0027DF0EE4|nr:acetyltransferase [Paenibacillus sp. LHD-117]MDQ6423266.1 acetyltransferase [Paenibacillus sp. LHD-117]
MSNRIILFGAGGHAKTVIDTIEKQGIYEIIGLLDGGKPAGEIVFGYEVLGDESWLEDRANRADGAIVAIGDNWKRGLVAQTIRRIRPGLPFVTAIHPSAVIARGARIGAGSVVMAGSVISCDVEIGDHTVLYPLASVDHDSKIGSFVSFAPKGTTGGNVTIGEYTAVAIGATIIHGVTIGEHSVIGAGSTLIRDIGSHTVAFGTPARPIRSRLSGERYL